MADESLFAVGRPGRRVLCPECATRLLTIWKYGDRWTLCGTCDAGWLRRHDLDTRQRVGPPVMLRIEEQRR